jgi:uncharacterized surface protein with fasciclin (FAS1) repeats
LYSRILQVNGHGSSYKNPFTSLAPNSDAFKSLESSAAPNLEKPENPNQLAGLLKNHINQGNPM